MLISSTGARESMQERSPRARLAAADQPINNLVVFLLRADDPLSSSGSEVSASVARTLCVRLNERYKVDMEFRIEDNIRMQNYGCIWSISF